ncbi:hypothetical protein G4B88_005627 [Cannabis sativa]|uniref:Reverse transcriptase n=1 Tax=Cannabis sativa TaxID=3483 RepID=A0A7J6H9W8_CANSA|nr:hypothetical protein G4B88_005627 [Cannabis sativa]
MAEANLSALFENSVQVTTNEITCDLHPGEVDHSETPNRVLLGKLYCFSRLGRKAIQGSLNNAWSSLEGWSWKEREDGLLQFTFQSSFDADNVLLRRPWLVCGHLLVLMPWPSWLTPEEVVFDQTPLWVRLKSIPPFYWNKTNLQELAGKVSAVYELPRHIEKNFERGSFGMGTVRFRATVDIDKPLFSGFYLRRKGIKDLWIQYQYEKLPKMCFKCGALSHEMKFCFKTPTVIKDDKGSFFPMYGTWMNEDAIERSPFQLPLPRWFSEWILNQQALKDPVIQNRLRNDRRWKEADSMECRELKRQLPGKRRHVEVLVEKRPETQELVLNRFPAVHLPGIGEITPFENTADLVVEKDIPVRPLQSIVTSPGVPSSPSAEDGTQSTEHSDGKSTLTNQGRNLPGKGVQDLQFSSPTELISSPGDARDKAVEERENFTLQRQFQIGQYINSLLGPQAQPLEWPSRVCWARAFEPLTGSITIDKFHREPTLFNPILQIEDFKCPEVERGPKKRKATDGFFMIPGVLPTEVAEEEISHSESSGVICKVHEADKNVIFGTIESDPPGVIWNFLGIYGPPTLTGKELFWTRIGTIISNCNTPVVLFGDLNGTLADHECINYVNRKNSARYSFDLRRMVNRTGLIDLGCQGGRFTWFQKTSRTQGSSSVKRARLDRALASTDWRVLFPNAIVELLSVGTSDHKPIILNTIGGARCIRPQFKYELMWGRDPRCFWVVRNAWREELHYNPMINFYRKLKMTKNHLQKWNKAQFRNWFQREDAQTILNIDLPNDKIDDSWMWLGEHNGNFSIKSAYRMIKGHDPNHEEGVWKLIWNSPIHSRLKFLWWQVYRDILPTKGRLANILQDIQVTCPLCKEAAETTFHLFWTCSFAKAIWFSIGWGIRTENYRAHDWKMWFDWFRYDYNRPPNVPFMDWMVTTLCIFEVIWSERNRRVHNESDNDLPGIMRLVRFKIKDHMLVPNHRVPEVVSWAPPPPSWVTCNTDVAVSSNGSMLSAVFRNDRGKIISITTREVLFSDPLIAEANAVCLAAEVARDSGIQRVLFLCDNLCVANSFAASAHCIGDFRIQAAATRFKDFCSKLEEWEIVHISRLCNYMAHNIAKWALMHQKTGTIGIEDIHERVLDDFNDWDPGPAISL